MLAAKVSQETYIPMDKSLLQMPLHSLIEHYNHAIVEQFCALKECMLELLGMFLLREVLTVNEEENRPKKIWYDLEEQKPWKALFLEVKIPSAEGKILKK